MFVFSRFTTSPSKIGSRPKLLCEIFSGTGHAASSREMAATQLVNGRAVRVRQ